MSDEDQSRLAELLLDGPARELYSDDISDEDFQRSRDRQRWRKLAALKNAGSTMTAEMESLHDELSQVYESIDDHDEAVPISYTIEDLRSLDDEELIDALLAREDLLELWEHTATKDGSRCLALLLELDRRDEFSISVWVHSLRGLSRCNTEELDIALLLETLSHVPEDIARKAILPLTRIVDKIAEDAADQHLDDLLALWDRLVPLSLQSETWDSADRPGAAINHPTGTLAEALFKVVRTQLRRGQSGIDSRIINRFETILELEGEPGRLGRTILASRLAILHSIEREWTEAKVIPLFAWDNELEAVGAWQGYLWGASIGPSLWKALKPHFVAALDHSEQIGTKYKSNLAQLLAATSEIPNALTSEETRDCLRELKDAGRAEVTQWLNERMVGAGDQAEELWADRIGPWIKSVWPKDQSSRGPHSSAALVRLIVAARDAFPEAVEVVADQLVPFEHGGYLVRELLNNRYVDRFPEASLDVLHRIIDEDSPTYFGEVGQCLRRISEADPGVEEDPRFVTLREIAIQKGWL